MVGCQAGRPTYGFEWMRLGVKRDARPTVLGLYEIFWRGLFFAEDELEGGVGGDFGEEVDLDAAFGGFALAEELGGAAVEEEDGASGGEVRGVHEGWRRSTGRGSPERSRESVNRARGRRTCGPFHGFFGFPEKLAGCGFREDFFPDAGGFLVEEKGGLAGGLEDLAGGGVAHPHGEAAGEVFGRAEPGGQAGNILQKVLPWYGKTGGGFGLLLDESGESGYRGRRQPGIGEFPSPGFLFAKIFHDFEKRHTTRHAAQLGNGWADAAAEIVRQAGGVERAVERGGLEPLRHGADILHIVIGKLAKCPRSGEVFGGETEGIPKAYGAEFAVGGDHIVRGEDQELAGGGGLGKPGKWSHLEGTVGILIEDEDENGRALRGHARAVLEEADVAGAGIGIVGATGMRSGGGG